MAEPRGRIYSLQWLRFIAAGMVLLYHAHVYLGMMRGPSRLDGLVPGWFGVVGVAIFFALSGYLMSIAMTRYDAPRFLLHRVARIYPTFLAVVALFLAVSQFSVISFGLNPWALSLLPYGGGDYPLGVEWTLVLEVAFYLFVTLLIWTGRTGSAAGVLVGWLALLAITELAFPVDPSLNVYPAHLLPFVPINVAFAAGMLAPLVLKRVPHPVLAALVATAIWLGGSSMGGARGYWGLGLGAALLVVSLARFTGWRPVFGDTRLGRLGDRLGNASYVLYLVHVPIIRMFYASSIDQAPARIALIAVSVCLVVALVLGDLDTRAYRRLKALVDRLPARVRLILAVAFVAVYAVAVVLHW